MSEEHNETQQASEQQASEKPRYVQGLPDREGDLAADALEWDTPPADSARYELKDVEDSPVGGHQEQVLKEE